MLLAAWLAAGAAAGAPAGSEETPAAAAEPEAASPVPSAASGRFGVDLDRRQPLEIRADEFEAAPGEGGGKRFTFRRNVEVTQADLSIRAERLDAYYGPKSKDPERLEASGNVIVVQGDREARCETATYLRESDSLVCRGAAELRDGRDRVRGQVIEFDLAAEIVTVTGGAELELHPRPEDAPGSAPGEEGS
jgi:lipopolysaccharide export system protein LptA